MYAAVRLRLKSPVLLYCMVLNDINISSLYYLAPVANIKLSENLLKSCVTAFLPLKRLNISRFSGSEIIMLKENSDFYISRYIYSYMVSAPWRYTMM